MRRVLKACFDDKPKTRDSDADMTTGFTSSASEWLPFEVLEKVQVGRDTYQLTFKAAGFGNVQDIFGGRGSHMECAAEVNGEIVTRPYTPYVLPGRQDAFELVVKGYELGKLSKHIVGLSVGQTLNMQGPLGGLAEPPSFDDNICFVAAGTGITPLLQMVYHRLAKQPDLKMPGAYLMFANHSEDDIILRQEIRQLSETLNMQLQLVLSDAPSGWGHSTGRVSVPMMKSFFPPPRADVHVFWCGPPGFHEHMRLCASQIGFAQSNLHEFMGLIGGQALAPSVVAPSVVEASAAAPDTKASTLRHVSLHTEECGAGGSADTEDHSGIEHVFVKALGPGLPVEGDRTHISVQGRHVTVFREAGRLYCMDSICYHAGGPLTIGDIEDVVS
jgi:cytochrome-b5 reductase